MDVKDYQFHSFDQNKTHFSQDVEDASGFVESKIVTEGIADSDAENELKRAKSTTFQISPIVKKYRGLSVVEQKNLEKKIQERVDNKLGEMKQEGYRRGFTEGMQEGFIKAKEEADVKFDELLNIFEEQLSQILSYREDVFNMYREQMHKTIKILSKWIILKEVKDDGYLDRLLNKLILEIHTKTDLLIKVNAANFENMPDVIDRVQTKLGNLSNIRIEIEPDLNYPGIIIETPKGIIDGSLESQFASLDKLFSGIGINDEQLPE